MKINRSLIIILICFLSGFASAQLKTIKGKVIANEEVEGIHILNKTALKYTVTDTDGYFEILAKVSDSLVISSLKYIRKTIIVTKSMVDLRFLEVALDERVTELDEVIVGRIFTGNLNSDIKNTEIKEELNFYNLGIPGYTGKPLTQNERRLHDADSGPWGSVGLGFSVNFHKLLNRVSGRTKKLREIVRLDANEKCVRRMRDHYQDIIFQKEVLADSLKTDYFYFCSDDANFDEICKIDNGVVTLEFLQKKLKAYMTNRNSTGND